MATDRIQAILYGCCILIVAFQIIKIYIYVPLLHSYKARKHGCLPVPLEPTFFPFGLDMVRRGLLADKAQRTPEFVTSRFAAMGRYTFRICILGSSNFITAEPENVKAILASQFNDFGMGNARRTNLKIVLGRSIFAVDGEAWHSARAVMRPVFARENIADLKQLEQHVQRLFECIEGPKGVNAGGWTGEVSLGDLLPCLTLDSATELFLGQSSDSLEGWKANGGKAREGNFQSAFELLLKTLSVRMRLRGLYWLYGNKELMACMKTLHGFVDEAIMKSDEAKARGTNKKTAYEFLDTVRSRCADQAEVREQVLGLLAAGRDTTASLMGWVFYCLVRNPRVWAKLRGVILETFGRYNPDAQITAETVTFHNLKGCKYLQYVLNETLRLHSVVAFNSRRALKDTTIPKGGGPDGQSPVFVPAGTEVNFSTHVMHRRKDLWGEDAERFVPERWETARPGWSFTPFNGGPRLCIGQQFALTEAGYVIVRLLQRYEAIDGLDIDPERDHTHFTVVASPGSPLHGNGSVRCKLMVEAS